MQHEAFPLPEDAAPAPVAARRPRIVVAGEFGAGKSSVINAMLRRPLLPYDIGASNRPLISLYHADQTGIVVTPWAGEPYEVGSLAGIDDPGDVQGLAIRTPMPRLEGAEIVELPFHHDGQVPDGVIDVMASADLLIWVTIASQAWRLTEKTVLDRLPERSRAKRVLAVSRADKLRGDGDAEKIEARIRREGGGGFAEIVFLRASPARLSEAGESEAAWSDTGGAALMAAAEAALGPTVQRQRALPDQARLEPEVEPEVENDGALTGAGQDAAKPQSEGQALRPLAAAGVKRPGVPVFIRSGAASRPEHNSQDIRDNLARTKSGRSATEVTDEIEAILTETSGLDAAGIGNFREVQVIKSFRSTAGLSVDANVLASAICLNSAVSAAGFLAPDDFVEEVMFDVGPQSFLIVPINRDAGTFAFFVVQANRVNPAIMRVLLRRVVAIWDEVRQD